MDTEADLLSMKTVLMAMETELLNSGSVSFP